MPKARPKVTRNGTYMPREYTQWKADFGMLVKAAMNRGEWRQDGRVKMTAEFYKDSVVLTLEDADTERFGQSDIDNLLGGVMDAIQEAGVIKNDRDVVEVHGTMVKNGAKK